MARIEGVEESKAGWFAHLVYRMARKRLSKMPEPLAIQAHHGAIFKGNAAFEYALEHAKLVDHKLKALAEIKASSPDRLSLVNGYRLCRRQRSRHH